MEFITNQDFYKALMEEEMNSKIEREKEKFLISSFTYYGNDLLNFLNSTWQRD